MAQEDDKGFFDRLGEILNAPLPGTERPSAQTQVAVDEEDDDSLMERIKDILNAPLPGTAQADTAGEAAGSTPPTASASNTPAGPAAQTDAAAPQVRERTPQLDEDELDEPWWQQDWAAFRAHPAHRCRRRASPWRVHRPGCDHRGRAVGASGNGSSIQCLTWDQR